MGYNVEITKADWVIKDNHESLAVVRAMPTKYRGIMRGGDNHGKKWFSWMNNEDIENATSVQDVFNALGFETETLDGKFGILGYSSKRGQEELFLAELAPFTEEGSYIIWVGEDTECWRYKVKDKKMVVSEATVTFSRPEPYRYSHYATMFYPSTDLDVSKLMTGWKELNIDIYNKKATELVLEQLVQNDKNEEEYWKRFHAEKDKNGN